MNHIELLIFVYLSYFVIDDHSHDVMTFQEIQRTKPRSDPDVLGDVLPGPKPRVRLTLLRKMYGQGSTIALATEDRQNKAMGED